MTEPSKGVIHDLTPSPWSYEDIRYLKPEWSDERIDDFVSRNARHFNDRLTELGWDVLDSLIGMDS